MPKGHLIAYLKVTDLEAFVPYKKRVVELVDEYQGKLIVKAPKDGRVLENANVVGQGSSTVVIEFKSSEKCKDFYDSVEYQKAKQLRMGNSESDFVLVEGAA